MFIAKYYLNGEYSLYDINNTKENVPLLSPVFQMNSFKWYLSLHPNQKNADQIESFRCYIFLAYCPRNLDFIHTSYSISLSLNGQTAYSNKRSVYFSSTSPHFLAIKDSKITFDQIKSCNKLSLNLKINATATLNQQYKIIPFTPIRSQYIRSVQILPFSKFKYCISDPKTFEFFRKAKSTESFHSKIFRIHSIPFYLRIYPNGKNPKKIGCFHICIYSLIPNPFKFAIRVKFSAILEDDKGTNQNTVFFYRYFDVKKNFVGWTMCKTSEIASVTKLTINTELTIMDIFDENDNCITNSYLQQNPEAFEEINNLSPVARYEWKISDNQLLKKIKNASNIVEFKSPIFSVFGSLWRIVIYPNGSRESRIGTLNVFLHILLFKTVSTKYAIKFNLSFVEAGVTYTFCKLLRKNVRDCGEINWPLNTNDIQTLNELTFVVELTLIDVYDGDKVITSQICNLDRDKTVVAKEINDLTVERFRWNITEMELYKMKEAKSGEMFESKIFELHSMKWKVNLFPNGKDFVDLCIQNMSLPTKTSVISIEYTIIIDEINMKLTRVGIFDKDTNIESWGKGRMSYSTLKQLDHCSITVEMGLVGIYDECKQHAKRMENFVKIQKEIDDLIEIIEDDFSKMIQI